MSSSEFDLYRSPDLLSEKMSLRSGCYRVARAVDHERRGLDLRNRFALIHIADSSATGCITLGQRVLEHLLCPSDLFRERCPKLRPKPALDDSGSHGLHSILAYGCDARVPHLFCADASRSVREHQAMQAAGRMNSQPNADHAAHREPAEIHTVEAKRIQQTEDVATQLLDCVVGRCY